MLASWRGPEVCERCRMCQQFSVESLARLSQVFKGVDDPMEPVLRAEERDAGTDLIGADVLRETITAARAAGPVVVVLAHADLQLVGDHDV